VHPLPLADDATRRAFPCPRLAMPGYVPIAATMRPASRAATYTSNLGWIFCLGVLFLSEAAGDR
jgi:hypothetical protein